jgi:hypothetical protein
LKKASWLLLVVALFGIIFFAKYRNQEEVRWVPSPPEPEFTEGLPKIENEKSVAGTRENPTARKAYNLAMVVDPATGTLPPNIKRREHLYAARLPKKNDKSAFRGASTQASDWRSIGPYNFGGRTRALAIDATNENIIMAGGVSGGMWRTEDGGRRWTKTTVPSSLHSVSCIVQDKRPGKTNIWYYGTGEFTANSASKKAAPYRGDGVFKSVDNGRTWFPLASTAEGVPNNYNSQFQYISKLVINNNNLLQDEVFVATVGAIFRSLDGGLTWNAVLGTKLQSTPDTDLNSANISDYTDIAQSLDGGYYAVFSQSARSGSSPNRGVYRSANGTNWTRITPGSWPTSYARTVIAPSTTRANEVYFSVNANFEMLWKFTLTGESGSQINGIWQNLSQNLPAYGGEVGDYDSQSSYNMVLEVHPQNGDIVFLGGTNLYRSSDGFSTDLNTAWIGGYDTANNIKIFPNHFVDQHALAFFPSNPDKMLSSNDGGVFITEDNIRDLPVWMSLNNGFVTTQFYTLGLDEFGSRGYVMGGLQDNGTLIANKPIDLSSWVSLLSGDGGYSAITRNSAFYFGSFQFGKVYRFTLNNNLQIATFARVDPEGSGEKDKLLFVNPYVLAPENQHFMYFAGGDVMWRNFNTSQIPLFKNYSVSLNWEKMTDTFIGSGIITAVNASYNPTGRVIFGTDNGRLFRINTANQVTYTVDEITSSVFPQNAYVASIAFDRKNSDNLAVAFSNYNIISVFYSTDGGNTFQNISGNLEENPDGSGSGPSVRWVEILTKNDGSSVFYAATSVGLFSAENLNGINTIWEKEGAETMGNVLVTMIKYFSKDGTLVASTHGNGMYESTLGNVWPTEILDNGQSFSTKSAFPNPFTDHVNIPFTIPRDGVVRAQIYNALGQNIKTILWASQFKGENMISWDGTNDAGSKVNYGWYFCNLEFEDQALSVRLLYYPK